MMEETRKTLVGQPAFTGPIPSSIAAIDVIVYCTPVASFVIIEDVFNMYLTSGVHHRQIITNANTSS